MINMEELKIVLEKIQMSCDESVDKTFFPLNHVNDFLLVQINVNHIIFGGSSHVLVSRFQEMMEEL
jgi:hypothetical protein